MEEKSWKKRRKDQVSCPMGSGSSWEQDRDWGSLYVLGLLLHSGQKGTFYYWV